ncbi:hypothetical protein OIU74_030232 [Salix koriyanagi]|uniref:Uncharacterized protein n=1 Tax=Salix koriyanagi TaxID=2511006 RepID=A0A9Q0ZV37_9ROSI|nr:hypothetical protein OIU74_030232 [Salix koriyanagi]
MWVSLSLSSLALPPPQRPATTQPHPTQQATRSKHSFSSFF